MTHLRLKHSIPRRKLVLAGLVMLTALPFTTGAQTVWPERPIRLIVAYPPGGSTDTTARMLAETLSRRLGQQIVVENRAGAGGTIGALSVARAPADGYTLLFAASPEVSIAPTTMKALAYSPLKDFEPISAIGQVPFLLVVNPELPVTDVKTFVSYAKANPAKLNYSSFGNNTSNHLTGELFNQAAAIRAVHVPYKGSGPSMTDLMAGQVQYSFDTPTAALSNVNAGKLRALAVTSERRLPTAPGIPTVAESGFPGFSASTWFGLLAPAKTPARIIDRLNLETVAALKSPEFSDALKARGITPIGSTPADFKTFLTTEIAKWKQLAGQVSIIAE